MQRWVRTDVGNGRVAGEHGSLFRSWARHEPRRRGDDTCAATLHRGYDPASQARPRWAAADCGAQRPFVCTRRGWTVQHVLTVTGALTLSDGGTLRGGGVVTPGSLTLGTTSDYGIIDGAGLRVDGTLSVQGALMGRGGAWVEYADLSGDGLWFCSGLQEDGMRIPTPQTSATTVLGSSRASSLVGTPRPLRPSTSRAARRCWEWPPE